MQKRLNEAVKKLKDEKLCCVVQKNDELFTSSEFGIKPLMIFLRQDNNFFKNAVIADKVIGKAAALLMILGGAEAVYGEIISESAIQTLTDNGIYFEYGQIVPYIKNRTDDGMCPMEKTVQKINSPSQAFIELEKTISVLMKNKA